MAIMNYLISGLPGTGKTSVCNELRVREYNAIDADHEFGYQSEMGWFWDENKIAKYLNDKVASELFICGSASNREKYITQFNKIFILYVDDKTLKRRLLGRTNNDFGKDSVVLAHQLKLNQGV